MVRPNIADRKRKIKFKVIFLLAKTEVVKWTDFKCQMNVCIVKGSTFSVHEETLLLSSHAVLRKKLI